MARPLTGGITPETLGDGTLAFRLRFRANGKRQTVYLHEKRGCDCGCGGGWSERTARVELDRILACVTAGVWAPPERRSHEGHEAEPGMPTFHEYSSRWLKAKVDGVIGEQPIRQSTKKKYDWQLSYPLDFLAEYKLDEIDRGLCLAFKERLLELSRERRAAIERREAIEAKKGQRDKQDKLPELPKPLSPASTRMIVGGLVAVLDDAVEDGYIKSNPARSKRMRIKVPKPKRTFLEIDELAALISAAEERDRPRTKTVVPIGHGRLTAAMVGQLFSQGKSSKQIATQLGLAKSTVSYHLSKLDAKPNRGYIGRRVIIEILGRGGPRVSELCDMKIGHVRLHDADGARFHIPDSKTDTGIREVQMTPDLVDAVREHIKCLRAAGMPTGPNDYLVRNLRGGRISYGRIEEIVREAAKRASELMTAKAMPPLPHTTPHTLRRTYISIELLATNFDVKYVMSQVGHADSKMTMDVYAQMQNRVKRDRGAAFDKLVRDARRHLKSVPDANAQPSNGTANGTEGPKRPSKRVGRKRADDPKVADLQPVSEWAIQDSNLGPLPYQRSALTD